MSKKEIQSISFDSESYPRRMKPLGSMPKTLYCLGELPSDDLPTVGIVGARLCSPYGRETAYRFGRELAGHGVQIISGMAAGIDGFAQEGALDGGGKSFAVLGCGVDVCYPRGNAALYNRLLDRGGILSEQPPGTAPLGVYFPSRNRIISALSDILLVVEARSRSGSLITVDFALSQGRSVYAVPGRVGDALSDGCNYLIAQGAAIAYAPEAILSELKLLQDAASFGRLQELNARFRRAAVRFVKSSTNLSEAAKKVYLALSFEDALYTDRITEKTALPAGDVRAALTELLKHELIVEENRDAYVRSRYYSRPICNQVLAHHACMNETGSDCR